MTPEDKLSRWFASQTPPARDLAFEASVAERIALRRAWATAGALAPWAIAATAILWALAPLIEPLGQAAGAILAPAVATVALGLLTLVAARWMDRRFNAG